MEPKEGDHVIRCEECINRPHLFGEAGVVYKVSRRPDGRGYTISDLNCTPIWDYFIILPKRRKAADIVVAAVRKALGLKEFEEYVD